MLSRHRIDLRDGRRRPLPQPSTRHGKPARTFTLKGALRGLPADGGASATPVPTRGKAFPSRLFTEDIKDYDWMSLDVVEADLKRSIGAPQLS